LPGTGVRSIFPAAAGMGNRVSLMHEVSHDHAPPKTSYPEFFHSLSDELRGNRVFRLYSHANQLYKQAPYPRSLKQEVYKVFVCMYKSSLHSARASLHLYKTID